MLILGRCYQLSDIIGHPYYLLRLETRLITGVNILFLLSGEAPDVQRILQDHRLDGHHDHRLPLCLPAGCVIGLQLLAETLGRWHAHQRHSEQPRVKTERVCSSRVHSGSEMQLRAVTTRQMCFYLSTATKRRTCLQPLLQDVANVPNRRLLVTSCSVFQGWPCLEPHSPLPWVELLRRITFMPISSTACYIHQCPFLRSRQAGTSWTASPKR